MLKVLPPPSEFPESQPPCFSHSSALSSKPPSWHNYFEESKEDPGLFSLKPDFIGREMQVLEDVSTQLENERFEGGVLRLRFSSLVVDRDLSFPHSLHLEVEGKFEQKMDVCLLSKGDLHIHANEVFQEGILLSKGFLQIASKIYENRGGGLLAAALELDAKELSLDFSWLFSFQAIHLRAQDFSATKTVMQSSQGTLSLDVGSLQALQTTLRARKIIKSVQGALEESSCSQRAQGDLEERALKIVKSGCCEEAGTILQEAKDSLEHNESAVFTEAFVQRAGKVFSKKVDIQAKQCRQLADEMHLHQNAYRCGTLYQKAKKALRSSHCRRKTQELHLLSEGELRKEHDRNLIQGAHWIAASSCLFLNSHIESKKTEIRAHKVEQKEGDVDLGEADVEIGELHLEKGQLKGSLKGRIKRWKQENACFDSVQSKLKVEQFLSQDTSEFLGESFFLESKEPLNLKGSVQIKKVDLQATEAILRASIHVDSLKVRAQKKLELHKLIHLKALGVFEADGIVNRGFIRGQGKVQWRQRRPLRRLGAVSARSELDVYAKEGIDLQHPFATAGSLRLKAGFGKGHQVLVRYPLKVDKELWIQAQKIQVLSTLFVRALAVLQAPHNSIDFEGAWGYFGKLRLLGRLLRIRGSFLDVLEDGCFKGGELLLSSKTLERKGPETPYVERPSQVLIGKDLELDLVKKAHNVGSQLWVVGDLLTPSKNRRFLQRNQCHEYRYEENVRSHCFLGVRHKTDTVVRVQPILDSPSHLYVGGQALIHPSHMLSNNGIMDGKNLDLYSWTVDNGATGPLQQRRLPRKLSLFKGKIDLESFSPSKKGGGIVHHGQDNADFLLEVSLPLDLDLFSSDNLFKALSQKRKLPFLWDAYLERRALQELVQNWGLSP